LVTSAAHRITVQGQAQHEFVNPAGLRFVIGCFAAAPGVVAVGEPSAVWTWFPGYEWQAVVCRACSAHLGWSYARGEDRFFGLILERLLEGSQPNQPP
jgi:hypothetical protein